MSRQKLRVQVRFNVKNWQTYTGPTKNFENDQIRFSQPSNHRLLKTDSLTISWGGLFLSRIMEGVMQIWITLYFWANFHQNGIKLHQYVQNDQITG